MIPAFFCPFLAEYTIIRLQEHVPSSQDVYCTQLVLNWNKTFILSIVYFAKIVSVIRTTQTTAMMDSITVYPVIPIYENKLHQWQ